MTVERKRELTQWHPGFCSAVRLELWDNREDLEYTNEYNLNRKPLQIDLLVIKKDKHVQMSNEIGTLFREHNIMEYKSPEDELNIDVYFKGLAYACLYKAAGRYVDEIAAEEITITFVRDRKPIKLLRQLAQKNRCVEQVASGIYYIREPWFPVQIIVTSQLDKEGHVWLRSLTEHLTKIEAKHLVYQIRGLRYKDEKEFADSVLQVAMSANKETFDKLKEDNSMCEALMELMRPEYEAGMKIATEQGMAQGMARGMVQGRQHEIFASVQDGDYSPERGAEKLNISIDEFQKQMLEAGYGN